ncbi:VOC family protein [Pseudomaricurvus sp.]|uniref:VOC family protein n=1 Tax=Pseudomaricurvus sp. TaxID=2004510 RepID=UPI003F6B059E
MTAPMKETGKINYVELPARNLEATKRFFGEAFDWSFVDYGPEYVAFDNAGLDGGFFKSDRVATTENGSVLVVLYSDALEDTLARVTSAGGAILKDIFSFPGGRRFHFSDPNGNEYAVWSEPEN